MRKRRHRWLRRLTAGLAFAVLAVPTAAQARIVEDSGIGSSDTAAEYNGYGYQQSPGVPVAQQNTLESNAYYVNRGGMWVKIPTDRPDDRAVRFTPQGERAIDRPDDRAVRFTPQGEPATGSPQVVAAPSDGFNWSDAGIGAGAAVGLMLLALGAAAALRHSGRGRLAGA